jgi:hypothetical protein
MSLTELVYFTQTNEWKLAFVLIAELRESLDKTTAWLILRPSLRQPHPARDCSVYQQTCGQVLHPGQEPAMSYLVAMEVASCRLHKLQLDSIRCRLDQALRSYFGRRTSSHCFAVAYSSLAVFPSFMLHSRQNENIWIFDRCCGSARCR